MTDKLEGMGKVNERVQREMERILQEQLKRVWLPESIAALQESRT